MCEVTRQPPPLQANQAPGHGGIPLANPLGMAGCPQNTIPIPGTGTSLWSRQGDRDLPGFAELLLTKGRLQLLPL